MHSIYNYYNIVKMYCHMYPISDNIIRFIATSWVDAVNIPVKNI